MLFRSELLYKVLFDMKKDLNDLKKVVADIVNVGGMANLPQDDVKVLEKFYQEHQLEGGVTLQHPSVVSSPTSTFARPIEIEESLSLQDKEIDMIKKALTKHKGKRKYAAKELGISERTLYRKINEYNIKE